MFEFSVKNYKRALLVLILFMTACSTGGPDPAWLAKLAAYDRFVERATLLNAYSAKTIPDKQLMKERWGPLADAANNVYYTEDTTRSARYSWVQVGAILEVSVAFPQTGMLDRKIFYAYDPSIGALIRSGDGAGSPDVKVVIGEKPNTFSVEEQGKQSAVFEFSADGYTVSNASGPTFAWIRYSAEEEIQLRREIAGNRSRANAEKAREQRNLLAAIESLGSGVTGSANQAPYDLSQAKRQSAQMAEMSASLDAERSREAAQDAERSSAAQQQAAPQRNQPSVAKPSQPQTTQRQPSATRQQSAATPAAAVAPNPDAGVARSVGPRASTDTDANICVSRPQVETKPKGCSTQPMTIAKIMNSCEQMVEARLCLLKADGRWDCRVDTQIRPGRSWSASFCGAGQTFLDARSAGSNRRFADPPGM